MDWNKYLILTIIAGFAIIIISIAFSWHSLDRKLDKLSSDIRLMSSYHITQRLAMIDILTEGNFIMSFLGRYASAMTDRLTWNRHTNFAEGLRAAYDQAVRDTYVHREPRDDDIGEFSRHLVIHIVREHLDRSDEQRRLVMMDAEIQRRREERNANHN